MPDQITRVTSAPRFVSTSYLVLGCLIVSYGWLLPNTNIPWIAFHRDAWISVWMSPIVFAAIFRIREATPWHWITILTAVFAIVPLLQLATGLLPFAGIAWISTAYVWGFLLATLTGALWAQRDALQPADAFFGCVGFAATLSVGMGMYQLFDLNFMGIWVLPPYFGEIRAYANLGQPNQLGTLLVWGVLSCGWTFQRGRIRLPVALAWCMFLLAGITLTHSRTATLTLVVLVALLWWWRRMWNVPNAKWIIAGLVAWVILLILLVPFIPTPASSRIAVNMAGKFASEARPEIWAMFLDASLQRPWAGYGWTQVSLAQMTVSPAHPEMIGRTLSHAHNLFLDLVLFMGWPLGLIASFTLVAWLLSQFRRTATAQDGILLAVVIAVGIHAMLELPLHYAYFLLPTGLVVGILNIHNRMPVVIQTPRWLYAGLCAGGFALLGAVVTDYLEVESNYQALRFEAAQIGTQPALGVPEVQVLTQMREILRLARFKVTKGMSEEQLQWMRDVTQFHSSLTNLHSLAVALAINGHVEESKALVKNVCDTISPQQCPIFKSAWKNSQADFPEVALIPGPP
jgi:O-antigen ligase